MVQTVNVVLLIPWAKESVLEQPGLICLPMAFFRLPAKAHIVLMASAGARAENGLQEFRPQDSCSWVFRDANNGSQSYQIPFIRVESCGR